MKHKKVILIVLIFVWMITIFRFSSEFRDKSSDTSGKVIRFILDKLSITKGMNDYEIYKLVKSLQKPIRKVAHFTIYTIGGAISFAFASQFNINTKKKIIYSILFCSIYAIGDEFHQYFVPR